MVLLSLYLPAFARCNYAFRAMNICTLCMKKGKSRKVGGLGKLWILGEVGEVREAGRARLGRLGRLGQRPRFRWRMEMGVGTRRETRNGEARGKG